jgi:UDP-N-acetylmuramyl pentapeptide synthase
VLAYLRMFTLRWGARNVIFYPLRVCLYPIARANRRRLRGTTFVGVTGSAGKTTTKNLLAAVLGCGGPVVASPGTANRGWSVLKTLLRTRAAHRYCVQEVAAFQPGSLDELLWALEPDVAVVTAVGTDHYSHFRGPEAVAAEKEKLVAALPSSGLAVLNADDARVRAMAGPTNARVVLYGVSADADVRAEEVQADWPTPLRFTLVYRDRRYPVETRLLGRVWTTAVLAALATGISLDIPLEKAILAVAAAAPEPHRLTALRTPDGATFLQDDWKGSVWTVPGALELLGSSEARRRIAIIGQLADDPRKPRDLYAAIAREARRHADLVVLVGRWAHHGLRARSSDEDDSIVAFPTVSEASAYLSRTLEPGDVVLLKGTHGTDHIERLAFAHAVHVRCWRTRCTKKIWCEDCRLLTRDPRDGLTEAVPSLPARQAP